MSLRRLLPPPECVCVCVCATTSIAMATADGGSGRCVLTAVQEINGELLLTVSDLGEGAGQTGESTTLKETNNKLLPLLSPSKKVIEFFLLIITIRIYLQDPYSYIYLYATISLLDAGLVLDIHSLSDSLIILV